MGKIILVVTHNGKRPIGSLRDELVEPDCDEIERKMAWLNVTTRTQEMIWRVYFNCGVCRGIIYTGITRPRKE